MLDLALRPVKEGVLYPFVSAIPRWISPNAITYLAFAFGLASPLLSSQGHVELALAAWLLNRLLDGLDGTIARQRGQQTAWGGYMDIVCDFTVYSLIPIGLAFSPDSPAPERTILPLSLLLAVVHVNNVILFYLSSAIPQTTKELTSLQMVPALIEGTESFALFTIMVLLPTWFIEIAYAFAALVLLNIVQRTLLAKQSFEKQLQQQ